MATKGSVDAMRLEKIQEQKGQTILTRLTSIKSILF